jgi:hypothetical protein
MQIENHEEKGTFGGIENERRSGEETAIDAGIPLSPMRSERCGNWCRTLQFALFILQFGI